MSKTYYDNLGRTTKTITDYIDGTPSASDDQTSLYTYDGANHILTLTANLPGTDQVTEYVFGFTTGALITNDALRLVKYPNKTLGTASTNSSDQIAYTIDALGQLLTKTDQNATVHTYAYDVLGRMTSDSVAVAGGNPQAVDTSVLRIDSSYNTQGLVDKVTSYNNTDGASNHVVNQVQNTYNGLGQLTQQTQEHNGTASGSSLAVQYAYSNADKGSRLTSMTYPNGTVLAYNYGSSNGLNDVISRLDSMSSGTITLESYKYLGMGTVVERDHPQDGINLTYIATGSGDHAADGGDKYRGLDEFGRVVDQRWVDSNNANADVDRYQYTYDRAGNVLTKVISNHTANNETYTYDALNRLTGTDRNDGTTNDQTWSLDGLGNMNSVTTNGSTTNRTSNSENQLTNIGASTLAYDNNGNVTTDDNGYTLKWDAWNRLVSDKNGTVTLASFAYDGMNRRIQQTVSGTTTDVYFSAASQSIEERVGVSYGNTGSASTETVFSPIYVNAIVARDTFVAGAFNERLYVTQNANFDVTSIISTAGAVQERMVYTSYGQFTFLNSSFVASSDTKNWLYTFQGMRFDSATGLIYANARYYSPTMMTWISADPAGYVNGLDNRAFVADNPINYTDPTGLDATDTQPATQPAIPAGAQPFIQSDDILLNGQLKIRVFTGRSTPPGNFLGIEPFHLTSTYIIKNNFIETMKTPISPIGDQSYPVPKGAAAGFANPIKLSFSQGIPFSITDPKTGKPLSDIFNDYIEVAFDGNVQTKVKCERVVGTIAITVAGNMTINGVKGTQAPLTQKVNFEAGDKNAKTKIQNISGSYSDATDFAPNNYVIFKLDEGHIEWKLDLTGELYKK